MLDEITITRPDLLDVKADIIDRYVRAPLVWTDVVDVIKREVYSMLKAKIRGDKPDYTNAQIETYMEDIKDLPNEKSITRLISTLTVAKILEHNDLNEEAAYYRQLAQSITLDYYIDEDDDDTVGDNERKSHKKTVLGR